MRLIQDILILIVALLGVWAGSGLILSALEKLASRLKASSFVVSFFILGFITSLTEINVAFNALINNEPEISVGNLFGGIIVIFCFIIPLLGILGKGIKLNHDLTDKNLFICIALLLSPFILILDKNINRFEALVLILMYSSMAYALYREETKVEKIKRALSFHPTLNGAKLVFSVILGAAILLLSSNFLVKETIEFAEDLKLTPFWISLLGLSIGTNLPELIVAIRSIIRKNKDVAFGNYIGSATFNILILAGLALVNGGITIQVDFIKLFIFAALGLNLFFWFARSKKELSVLESSILFGVYATFLVTELISL